MNNSSTTELDTDLLWFTSSWATSIKDFLLHYIYGICLVLYTTMDVQYTKYSSYIGSLCTYTISYEKNQKLRILSDVLESSSSVTSWLFYIFYAFSSGFFSIS
jgi:hypothetical protein